MTLRCVCVCQSVCRGFALHRSAGGTWNGGCAREALIVCEAVVDGLVLAVELLSNHCLQFLDLELAFAGDHAYRVYLPHFQKALLPFASSHSELFKWGTVVAA